MMAIVLRGGPAAGETVHVDDGTAGIVFLTLVEPDGATGRPLNDYNSEILIDPMTGSIVWPPELMPSLKRCRYVRTGDGYVFDGYDTPENVRGGM